MYSLVPGVEHLTMARHLLILSSIVRCWKICHAMLKGRGPEMMVLKWLNFHANGSEGPAMVAFHTNSPVQRHFLQWVL